MIRLEEIKDGHAEQLGHKADVIPKIKCFDQVNAFAGRRRGG